MSFSEFFDKAKVNFFNAGDAELAYRVFGAGPPLLLVHGWPLTGFTWRKALPALAERFTCLVPDLAGLGESRWDRKTDFSFPAQARRLRMLTDDLEWGADEPFQVVAQNTGGTIARFFALQSDPPRLSNLVLINTEIPDHRLPWIPLYQKLTYVPGNSLGFLLLLSSRSFLRSPAGFGGSFYNRDLIDGEFRDRFVRPLHKDSRKLEGAVRYLRGLDYKLIDEFRTQHADIQARVTLIWGADDPTFPADRAEKMARQFSPEAPFHRVPRARLLVHEENPEEVVRLVLAAYSS